MEKGDVWEFRIVRERRRAYGVKVTGAAEVYRLFSRDARELGHECAWAVLLDEGLHVVGVYQASQGAVASTLVPVAEIMRAALLAGASRLVLVHNHPSGNTTPSREDQAMFKRLREAGAIIGVETVDSVVVGESGYHSMAA